jgi:polo-like kinase 1
MDQKGAQSNDANHFNSNNKMDSADQTIIVEERIATVSGETAVRRYSRGKMLGKGGFAKCYEFVNLENKKLSAAKIIQKNTLVKNRAKQKLMSEIKIHRSLHQPNVVQFEHVFEDQDNVYILLELCSNQTLNELLKRRKRLIELEVQSYVWQIIQALKYLHSNRVIHRDLKLGNLFLNEKMELKLGDFGLATKLEFEGEKKRTICGTPNYIAPEILDGKMGHSYEVDIWSLGVIIYTLLIGKPPFETPDVKTTYKKIRMNSYSFPDHIPISDNARSLIVKILHLDPARRPTIDEVLAHPFLNFGGTIPKTLPLSTLACPPSASYVAQFQPKNNGPSKLPSQSNRLAETVPNANNGLKSPTNGGASTSNTRPNLISTDKISFAGGNKSKPTSPTANMQFDAKMFETEPGKKTTSATTSGKESTGTSQFNTINSYNTLQNNAMLASTRDLARMESSNKDLKSSTKIQFPQFNSSNNLMQQSTGSLKKASRAEIHVKKWVDYSSKYGLGYLLSNGSSGVFFNDSTKIILDPKGTFFEYIEKKMPEKIDVVASYTLTNFPKDLQKKVTLLQHFRSYLEGDGQKSVFQEYEDDAKQGLVYVKKWLKTKHAIMFRLNNKIVQVDFTDKTEIILSSEQKIVTYLNKKGERSQYPLASALESTNQEMAKRLKYTKDILTNMLTNHNPGVPMKDQALGTDLEGELGKNHMGNTNGFQMSERG